VHISVDDAVELLDLAHSNLEFDSSDYDDRGAHTVAIKHLSEACKKADLKGKVLLITAKDRNVRRYREAGRFSNAPDTKQQKDLAIKNAKDIPVLMLLRQNGKEEDGWRGLPFWWPVIMTPETSVTVVFSTNQIILGKSTTVDDLRYLVTEDHT